MQLEVKLDDQFQNFKTTVKNLTHDIQQKVLVEEGTGTWCANCPKGILAFEYMENQLPGQVVPVAIHQGDRYAWEDYLKFLNINAFPSAVVNRRPEIVAPIGSTGFTSDKKETWMDLALEEIADPAEVGINIEKANLCTENNMLEIHFNTDFAIEKKNIYYNVLAIVLESGISARQNNNLYNATEEIWGDWGANGKYGAEAAENGGYVQIELAHVARSIAGTSFYGLSGLIPNNVAGGEKISKGIQMEWPDNVKEQKNLSVALAIIDGATGRVVNCDAIHTVGTIDKSGVEEIGASEMTATFSVKDRMIICGGSADGIEVYTIDGMRVANSGLQGLYIARCTREGRTETAKIYVK